MLSPDDPAWLLAHLSALTDTHEASFPLPWKVVGAPTGFLDTMMKGIVALELPICRIEGKWKTSHNPTTTEREGVIAGINAIETLEGQAMSALIELGAHRSSWLVGLSSPIYKAGVF